MSYLQDLEDEMLNKQDKYVQEILKKMTIHTPIKEYSASVLGVGIPESKKPRVCPKCGRLVSYVKQTMSCDHGDYIARYWTWHCDFCLDEVLPHIECCPACRIEKELADEHTKSKAMIIGGWEENRMYYSEKMVPRWIEYLKSIEDKPLLEIRRRQLISVLEICCEILKKCNVK